MTPTVDPSDLEQQIAATLKARALQLATAESCTGGLIAHRLTNLAGSSAYYAGGVVSYSNALKESLLGVPRSTLEDHGAVSDAVASAMVQGARRVCGADWAVAVTGIAGPGGGTAAKPVGLVYIATAGPEAVRVTRNQFHGDRLEIKTQTAGQALTQLWEHLTA